MDSTDCIMEEPEMVNNGDHLTVRKRSLRVKRKKVLLNGEEKPTIHTNNVSPTNFKDAGLNSPENCFKWLIHPTDSSSFFRDTWEKKPLHVKRSCKTYYNGLFSCAEMEHILRTENLIFSRNIDITKYENGSRETLSADGRAYAPIVWDHFQNGCSVRLLNPQTYSKSLWKLNSTLQEYFGSFVGANSYLTPAGSQGFAPHYDDIEAFILQIEGRKKWKIYSPPDQDELPRFSSGNFKEEDMKKPVLEVELFPGDLLYFPRGFIHQAKTTEEIHSLHITLSTYQKNTWGDLFEKLVPAVLETSFSKDIEFRQGLPLNYLSYMGFANCDEESRERIAFKKKAHKLFEKMLNSSLDHLDAVADQMGKRFLHDSLPPFITKGQQARSIYGSGERWYSGKVENACELDPDTKVRLIRGNAIRLVLEEDSARVYHNFENTRLYHESESQYVTISEELVLGVECLISAYPSFIQIEDLPLNTLEEKMDLSNLFYEKGLLMTKEIMEPFEDSD